MGNQKEEGFVGAAKAGAGEQEEEDRIRKGGGEIAWLGTDREKAYSPWEVKKGLWGRRSSDGIKQGESGGGGGGKVLLETVGNERGGIVNS